MSVSEISNNYMNELKVELFRLYQLIIQEKSHSWTNDFNTDLYYIVKKIRYLSAIFHYKDLYEISSFIFKKIRVDKFDYLIKSEDKNVVFRGINILLKYIENLDNIDSHYITESKVNHAEQSDNN